MAYKKYWTRCGCNRLIDAIKTYCEVYARTNAEHDRAEREKKAKAFYNSTEWQTARATVLARDTGIDVYIYMTEHRVVQATMVHHIVELRKDYSKRSCSDKILKRIYMVVDKNTKLNYSIIKSI